MEAKFWIFTWGLVMALHNSKQNKVACPNFGYMPLTSIVEFVGAVGMLRSLTWNLCNN